MVKYTTDSPEFHTEIDIAEPRDPAHADILNTTYKQLFDNTMSLKETIDSGGIGGAIPQVDGETLIFVKGYAKVDKETLIFDKQAGTALVPATATQLGGVKIGRGINVEPDGTISTDVNSATEAAANMVESRMKEITKEEVDTIKV